MIFIYSNIDFFLYSATCLPSEHTSSLSISKGDLSRTAVKSRPWFPLSSLTIHCPRITKDKAGQWYCVILNTIMYKFPLLQWMTYVYDTI